MKPKSVNLLKGWGFTQFSFINEKVFVVVTEICEILNI